MIARLSAPPVAIADVTGAGDALIAGTLFDIARGAPLVASVQTGQLCAALTLESHGSVRHDLSQDLLRSARKRLRGGVQAG